MISKISISFIDNKTASHMRAAFCQSQKNQWIVVTSIRIIGIAQNTDTSGLRDLVTETSHITDGMDIRTGITPCGRMPTVSGTKQNNLSAAQNIRQQ